jgi:hypothetical protein
MGIVSVTLGRPPPAANQGRRFALAASANSTRRRIASEREGLSGCCLAQSSICNLSAGDSRTAVTGSWPVGGRPRFFRTTGIDFGINLYYVKSEPMRSRSFPPALTQATEIAMAQAECITTAIREVMSRGRPSKSASPVRAAHSEFVTALAGNVPHPLHSDVDSEDLEDRADHLEKVFAALRAYLTAIILDTAQNIPGVTLDRRYLDNLFQDLSADALRVIRNAAEEMRENENWRAS